MLSADAITYFKNRKKLAEALEITPSAVSQWGELVPPFQARRLDELTEGALAYDPSAYEGKYPDYRSIPAAVEAR